MLTKIDFSRRILLIHFLSSFLRMALSLSIMFLIFRELIASIPGDAFAIYPKLVAAMLFFPLGTTVLMSGLRPWPSLRPMFSFGDWALIMGLGSLGYGTGIWLAARPEDREELDKDWAKLRSFNVGGLS